MAFPLIPLLIGATAGLGKSVFLDAPREKRQRRAAAETIRMSPWTGMQPGAIQEADPFGGAIQGAALGGMFATSFPGATGATTPGTAGGTTATVADIQREIAANQAAYGGPGAGMKYIDGQWVNPQQAPWLYMGRRASPYSTAG